MRADKECGDEKEKKIAGPEDIRDAETTGINDGKFVSRGRR